jgi:hypothetical protein
MAPHYALDGRNLPDRPVRRNATGGAAQARLRPELESKAPPATAAEDGAGAICCHPRNTSRPKKAHRKYPYLLRYLKMTRAPIRSGAPTSPTCRCHAGTSAYAQAWTGIRAKCWVGGSSIRWMRRFCLGALSEAATGSDGGLPGIFNTDQGSQFTSEEWTGRLTGQSIAISNGRQEGAR